MARLLEASQHNSPNGPETPGRRFDIQSDLPELLALGGFLLWVLYNSDIFIMPATLPGFIAHEYSHQPARGNGAFSNVLGAESKELQIKLTVVNSETFIAPQTNSHPLF